MVKFKKYFGMVIGAVLMGLALDVFLVPSQIAPGGVSGLATVISYVTRVPVGGLIVILNIPIMIFGIKVFNTKFILDSLIGMLVLSAATSIFEFVNPITNDIVLSSVFGGALLGLGSGIVFRFGTTTGGTDIVVKILKKKFPEFSTGNFALLVDMIVVALAGIVFRRWEVVLYSVVALVISSFIVDDIVEGVDFAKMVFVMSDKPEEIADKISDKLARGATGLKGVSMYTGKQKNVLMCIVKKFEIGKLKKVINTVDPSAFVVVADVREVLGNGFKNKI